MVAEIPTTLGEYRWDELGLAQPKLQFLLRQAGLYPWFTEPIIYVVWLYFHSASISYIRDVIKQLTVSQYCYCLSVKTFQ